MEGLVKYGLGDWCFPRDIPNVTPMDNRFSDSCYYYRMQKIAAVTAEIFGEQALSQEYNDAAMQTKSAIIKAFVEGDRVDNDGQGALACALYYDLVEGEQAEAVLNKLVKLIEQNDYAFHVGILGVKALLNVLCEYERTDVAYKMIARTEYPSYGFWRLQGATTLWEDWDGYRSQNHHMFGDVLNVMARYIAGLRNLGVRYNECLIQPYFFAESCSAAAETRVGGERLSISWEKKEDEFILNYEIPFGVNATLKVEGMPSVALEQGAHCLKMLLKENKNGN